MDAGRCLWPAVAVGTGRWPNRAAFARWAVLPRLMRDMRSATAASRWAAWICPPLLLAPVAHQRLAHAPTPKSPRRAAAATGGCLVASAFSSCARKNCRRQWAGALVQLYLQPERATLDLLARAEHAGYGAIVVTLDASIQLASRARCRRLCAARRLRGRQSAPATRRPGAAAGRAQPHLPGRHAPRPTWDDLHCWLLQSRLPGVGQGACCTRRRTLHCAPQAARRRHRLQPRRAQPGRRARLPAIRAAVGPGLPRAARRRRAQRIRRLQRPWPWAPNAVLIGRLQMVALAVAGALGVAHMLPCSSRAARLMAQAGCAGWRHPPEARYHPTTACEKPPC